MVQVQKLVRWMSLRQKDPECALCLDEELVKYCTEELVAFAHEKEDTAIAEDPCSGLLAVVDAGAVEACLTVLQDQEIEAIGKVYAVTLLAELLDHDEVLAKYVAVGLIEELMPHMDAAANTELQALATSVVTNLVDVLEEPLPSQAAGTLMGTILWQLDSPNVLVAECASACLAVLCSDPIDGISCSTTAMRLGAVPRLRLLAGLDTETGLPLPAEEIPPDARITDVALDALEAISLAQRAMTEAGQTLGSGAEHAVGAGGGSAGKPASIATTTGARESQHQSEE